MVDGAEDVHVRPGREGGDEDLPLRRVEDRGLAAGEQLGGRAVVVGADEPLGAGVLAGDRDLERDRALLAHRLGDRRDELGVEPVDEDVHGAAAREPDLEGLLVGDAVGLEPRRAAREHVAGLAVDGGLDAAAGHRAGDLAALGDGQDGARVARSGPLGADHGGDRDRASRRRPSARGSRGRLSRRPQAAVPIRLGLEARPAVRGAEEDGHPSWTVCSTAPTTATVMPQTGSTASAAAGTGVSPRVCRQATSSARMATAISSCDDGPRSSPAGARTRRTDSSSEAAGRAARRARWWPAGRSPRGRRSRRRPERGREELLVAVAHRRDDDGVRALDAVVADAPADGARELGERARRGALPHDRQERSGNDGLDQHLDHPFRGAAALHAGEPRLSRRRAPGAPRGRRSAPSRRRRSSR